MGRITRRSLLAGLTLAAGSAWRFPAWARRAERIAAVTSEDEPVLWYLSGARTWNEGLPIGNGRLGGMVLADGGQHRILLNEESFWSGEPRDFRPQDGSQYMGTLLTLLMQENGPAADGVVYDRLLSKLGESYQPLGFLTVEDHAADEVRNFRRSLNLRDGMHSTTWSHEGGSVSSAETYVSAPDNVMVVQLRSDAGNVHCTVRLGSSQHCSQRIAGDVLLLEARAPVHVIAADVPNANGAVTWDDGPNPRGMRAAVALCVLEQTGGQHHLDPSELRIEDADAVTLLLAARTSYAGPETSPSREGLDATELALRDLGRARARHTGEVLRARHIADHRMLFDRVQLRLEGPENPGGTGRSPNSVAQDPSRLPTDVRLLAFGTGTGAGDPGLAALSFHLGRYLLIASSRPGSLPATTQGLWTHRMRPPHNANWALNGDLPASYWLAETAALPECHEPVFSLAERLHRTGTYTAKRLYGVHGWVAHTSADLWCSTLPDADSTAAAIWKCGGAWLCLQAWDAFRFSGDLEFLRAQYPRMREASLFFLEQMRADRDGWLASFPESSLGSPYRMPDGGVAYCAFSPTMNSAIVRELLQSTAAAAELLHEDASMQVWLLSAAGQLRPIETSRHTGELLEWPDPAWINLDSENDRLPQIWPLMPGTQIHTSTTPQLANAAHWTMQNRAPWQDHPGSAIAGWCANAMARLGDGDGAHRILVTHIEYGLLPNLLACTGRDEEAFAIAGNLSIAAATAEMLLQSHAGEIHFLPALPAAWPGGSFRGLRARDGWTVGLEWRRGHAQNAILIAGLDTNAVLRAPRGQTIQAVRNARDLHRLDEERVRFRASKGETYFIHFA